jgi:hypothetical protein
MAQTFKAGHLQLQRAPDTDTCAFIQFPGNQARCLEIGARVEFGGLDLAKEQCRDQISFDPFDRLLRDFRYTFRWLRKSPAS